MNTSVAALCQVSHEIAKEHGWLDKPRTVCQVLLLMQSELIEALEDWRANRGLTEIYFEKDKPCGIPIELADFCIRVAEYSGTAGIKLEKAVQGDPTWLADGPFEQILADAIADISRAHTDFQLRSSGREGDGDVARLGEFFAVAWRRIFQFAETNAIPLWEAIHTKGEYNRTRPYRHGNKRA